MRPLPFVVFVRHLGVTLTPAQRVLCGVCFDGVDIAALSAEDKAIARRLFGRDMLDVPPLARSTVCWVMGRGASKSFLGGLWLLWRALTCDVRTLAPGQLGYCLVIAPRMKLGREVINYARGAALRQPRIVVAGDNQDAVDIEREQEGRVVRIECLPASAHGAALRGRELFAAMLDETAFFRGEDAAISDTDLLRSLRPRLRGAPALIASTPWAKEGLLWDTYDRNFGHPVDAIAATAATDVMRPDDETRAMAALERARDPDNARRELDAEFLDGQTFAFFEPETIDRAMAHPPPTWASPPAGSVLTAGGDAGFARDASALARVARVGDMFHALEILERRPRPGKPLVPSEVLSEWADVVAAFGADGVVTDVHYRETVREYLVARGLVLYDAPSDVALPYVRTRVLLREDRVRLPNDPRLRQQLRQVVSRPTPGGTLRVSSPRGPGGHGDAVSALVLALHRAFGAEVKEHAPRPGSPAWEALRAARIEELAEEAYARRERLDEDGGGWRDEDFDVDI